MTISKNFKNLALGVSMTAMLAMSATPAFAGKDFIKQDLRAEETTVVQLVGQKLSHDNLTIVVHGGNKELMMAAYEVAQMLDDEGYSVAFLLAPDRDGGARRHNGNDITASVEFYTDGYTKYSTMLYDNKSNTRNSRMQLLYEQAKTAYNFAKEETAKKTATEGITIASASPK